MKKYLFVFFMIFLFAAASGNLFAEEKKETAKNKKQSSASIDDPFDGLVLGAQFSTLAEIGIYTAFQPYYYIGWGFNISKSAVNSSEEPSWTDMTVRLGYHPYFKKIGLGLLVGAQLRWLIVTYYWNSPETENHFIFMPEAGVSYTLKNLYLNAAYQFDTKTGKNSNLCFAAGWAL